MGLGARSLSWKPKRHLQPLPAADAFSIRCVVWVFQMVCFLVGQAEFPVLQQAGGSREAISSLFFFYIRRALSILKQVLEDGEISVFIL